MRTIAKPLLGWLRLLPAVLVSAAACGGSVFDGTGGLAGGNGNAGSGYAGSGNAGSGYAGSGNAGSGNAGSGHAGLGNAGSGTSGSSAGGITGSSGSGGSGGVDVTACASNSQCQVVPVGCCSCGEGPVSNYTAINSAYESQMNAQCGGLDCVPCGPVAFDPNNPVLYYVPTCQNGHCAIVDLRTRAITACKSASDCSLRSGTGCCSGCSGQPVALNGSKEPDLFKLECGLEPTACPACAPSLSGYDATCTDGRCSVELGPCTVEHPCGI
jgi:hypothetical protein